MTKYLAGVLTIIAAGTMLIAYGLLAPQVSGSSGQVGDRVDARAVELLRERDAVDQQLREIGAIRPLSQNQPVAAPQVRAVKSSPVVTRTVAAAPRRDWRKTALIIGGSSAAGAGIGGIAGGGKGALIGAAIGGGASTLLETIRH